MKSNFKAVINFFCCVLFVWSPLRAESLLVQEGHGQGYLIRVANLSGFGAKLEFPGASFGPFNIAPGGSLGDKIDSKGELVADLIAPISAIMKTRIWQNGADLTSGQDSSISKQPIISGVAVNEISNFNPSQLLFLQPLRGSAIAWLAQQDLTNPQMPQLDMTLSFLAYVRDNGQAHVVLSETENLSGDWVWKIVFDSQENGQATILKRSENQETVVAQISNAQQPGARLFPGKMNRFWISLKGNQILVGSGVEGQNPFLLWEDTAVGPRAIKRLGFSCDDNPLTITRVGNTSCVFPKVTAAPIAALNVANKVNRTLPLREAGSGAWLWESANDFSLQLLAGENTQEFIEVTKSGTALKISLKQDGTEVKTANFSVDAKSTQYWCLLQQDKLVLGQGEIGRRGKLCGLLCDVFVKSVNNVVWQTGAPVNVMLFAGANLATESWSGSKNSQPLFSGPIKIYQPYKLQFSQEGPSILCKDLLYGQTSILGKAPQQGAIYPFELTIGYDGNPDIKWYNKPVNLAKFFMNVAAFQLRILEAVGYSQGTTVVDEKGRTIEEDLALTAQNIAYIGGAAVVGAAAGALEAVVETQFRGDDAYAYTEEMQQKFASKGTTKKTAELADQIDLSLKRAKNLDVRKPIDPSKPNDFDYAIQLYSNAISQVQDASVLNEGQRSAIFKGVLALAEAMPLVYKDARVVFNRVLNLILSVLTNRWFFGLNNLAHKSMQLQLNTALQQTCNLLFFQCGRDKINVPRSSGFFLWTGKSLSQKGSMFFQVKAANQFTVQLIPLLQIPVGRQLGQATWLDQGSVEYQVVFGAERNTQTQIKVSKDGQPVASCSVQQNSAAALSGLEFLPYWIDVNVGKFTVGSGEWGQDSFLTWQDPYPWQGIYLVGLSSEGSAEVQDLRVSQTVGELTPEIINGQTLDEVERQRKLDEQAKSASVDTTVIQASDELTKAESPLAENSILEKQDPFKDGTLEQSDAELIYDPLTYGGLLMDYYNRWDAENQAYKEFYEQKAKEPGEVVDDDKLKADKMAALKTARDAQDKRDNRGALQKMSQQGFYAIKQEFSQVLSGITEGSEKYFNNIARPFSNEAKGLKVFSPSNLKNQFASTTKLQTKMLKQTTDNKEEVENEAAGNEDAVERVSSKAYKAEQTDKVMRSREAAKEEVEAKRAAATSEGERIQAAARATTKDAAVSKVPEVTAQTENVAPNLLDKFRHEFSQLKKISQRQEAKATVVAEVPKSVEKSMGEDASTETLPLKKQLDVINEDLDKARSPENQKAIDQNWSLMSYETKLAVDEAQARTDGLKQKAKSAQQVVDDFAKQLGDASTEAQKLKLADLQLEADLARDKYETAVDVEKMLRYHPDPAVHGKEPDAAETEKEVDFLQARLQEVEQQLAANPDDERLQKNKKDAQDQISSKANAVSLQTAGRIIMNKQQQLAEVKQKLRTQPDSTALQQQQKTLEKTIEDFRKAMLEGDDKSAEIAKLRRTCVESKDKEEAVQAQEHLQRVSKMNDEDVKVMLKAEKVLDKDKTRFMELARNGKKSAAEKAEFEALQEKFNENGVDKETPAEYIRIMDKYGDDVSLGQKAKNAVRSFFTLEGQGALPRIKSFLEKTFTLGAGALLGGGGTNLSDKPTMDEQDLTTLSLEELKKKQAAIANVPSTETTAAN